MLLGEVSNNQFLAVLGGAKGLPQIIRHKNPKKRRAGERARLSGAGCWDMWPHSDGLAALCLQSWSYTFETHATCIIYLQC